MTNIFDEARAAVGAGSTPEDAAPRVVAAMTPEERLWCLDGDAPTWAGLRFLGADGYHQAPFVAAEVEGIGLPGIAFADGPRGAVIGNARAPPCRWRAAPPGTLTSRSASARPSAASCGRWGRTSRARCA